MLNKLKQNVEMNIEYDGYISEKENIYSVHCATSDIWIRDWKLTTKVMEKLQITQKGVDRVLLNIMRIDRERE